MSVTAKVALPDEVEVDVTATFTLHQWRGIINGMAGVAYPTDHFRSAIAAVLRKIEQEFAEEESR